MEDSTRKILLQSLGVTVTTLGTFSAINQQQTVSADNVQNFINRVTPGVKSASKSYNTWGSVMMAQAALESAWGQSTLSTQANNYFGIKGTYNGQSVTMRTAEYDENGNIYYVDAQFRKYPSPTESMNDNGNVIRNGTSWNHAFYSGAWKENAKSYQAAANALTGKYATDPNYGSKLISLIQYNKFDKFVDDVAPAKYKVGQKVQINSNATNEANGYDLRNHQNWVGTIKSVENSTTSNSNHAYYIDYGDGNVNMHVLEQDLKTAPAAKFKAGQKVQVSYNAGSETNGFSLKDKQGLVGTIKSLKIKNHSYSHYEYWITYSNGTRSEHVAEQDLSSQIINAKPKYNVGQKIQISSNATNEANGYDLRNHQNWIGTIKSREAKKASVSNFAYSVDYGDGSHNDHVLEQDLKTAPAAKFKTGQKVQITMNAGSETNGFSLVDKQGLVGTIKSVKIKNHSYSHYEYWITYSDGTRSEHVAEQDLSSKIINLKAKYRVGQRVQVGLNAESETNGFSLFDKRGLVGTVKSVKTKNHSYSHFEYWITYSDGTRSEHVAEQDLSNNIVPINPKYKVGQKVKIANNAVNETNGFNLMNHRGQIGTVKSSKMKNYSYSRYEYWIVYSDGTRSEHVAEQDLTNNLSKSSLAITETISSQQTTSSSSSNTNSVKSESSSVSDKPKVKDETIASTTTNSNLSSDVTKKSNIIATNGE
ncbi:glycoside hydrolase family 73 protein [Weissella coleopterorum]|uniref:Glycoside hydrolase family 73 protein n=1 Tax=Weissella coleopterorum TaxID=2714949 RepID=A0A6G8AYC2_9LACO|nr:glycoside hydrolase family 73 protein [Weissella coleopterorum]QIL49952.1 glycoside hydrolase family 73 protein [Weissella coleopterorum]